MKALDFCIDQLALFEFGGRVGYVFEKLYTKDADRGCCPDSCFLPIYGAGSILVAGVPYYASPFILAALEFFGSKVFDKERKLWDYSDERFNIDGRISARSVLGLTALSIGLKPVLSKIQGSDQLGFLLALFGLGDLVSLATQKGNHYYLARRADAQRFCAVLEDAKATVSA